MATDHLTPPSHADTAAPDAWADGVAVPPSTQMSEDEFVAWAFAQEHARVEWVDGEVIVMGPVNVAHGLLLSFLNHLVAGFLEQHDLGVVLNEPVLVRFTRPRRQRMPDLYVVGNDKMDRLADQHFRGPPDLIIEIVSPDSRHRDAVEKLAEYAAAGVPEYWLPDRERRTWDAFTLGTDGKYTLLPEVDGVVRSRVFPGLFFRREWVWQLKMPKVAPLLAEMSADRARLLGGAAAGPG